MSSVYSRQVEVHGLSDSMTMMIERVPQGARVLDVGCASGYLAGPLLRERGCQYVDGIELDPAEAALANKVCRKVVVGSAEEATSYAKLDGPYDAVVFGDVLEHLRDPARALCAARSVVGERGVVVSSIPNVAHYSIRAELFNGRFDYADAGILDRTHLRFFTERSIRSLFADNGYEVQSCDAVLKPPARLVAWLGRKLADKLAGLRTDVFAFQYITVATPRS
jgi:2-polyprenyl-3-methyl-5-hydroxy-6-metoxy-1,4-benzoquinol methylase